MKKNILTFITVLFYSFASYGADLNEIFEAALSDDPLLSSASYKRFATHGDKLESCGRLFPQLTLKGGYVDYNQDEAGSVLSDTSISTNGGIKGNQYSIVVGLNQSVFDLPKFNSCKKWRKMVDRDEVDYKIAKEELIQRVVNSYLNVLAARSNYQFARAEVGLLSALYTEIKESFAFDTVSKRKVDKVNARLKAAKAKKISAQNDFLVTKESLESIYQKTISVDELLVLKDMVNLALPQPSDPDYWIEIAQQANLGLIQSRLHEKAMKYGADEEFSKHLPTVNLFANHNEYQNDIDRSGTAFSTDNGNFSSDAVGVQFTWKLFSGGSDYGRSKAAKNRHLSAREELEAKTREVKLETKRNMLNLLALMADIEASSALLVAAQSELDAINIGRKSNIKTKTDILEAKLNLLEAKAEFDKTRYDYVTGMMNFWKSIGTVSQENIKEINTLFVDPSKNRLLFSENYNVDFSDKGKQREKLLQISAYYEDFINVLGQLEKTKYLAVLSREIGELIMNKNN